MTPRQHLHQVDGVIQDLHFATSRTPDLCPLKRLVRRAIFVHHTAARAMAKYL
jgi:hypothetical protein